MRAVELNRLERAVDELAPLFFGLMLVSLLAILVGSTGSGALLLILGAGVQVVRGACEELAVSERRRVARVKPVAGASRARVSAGAALAQAQGPSRRRGFAG